MIMPPLPGSLRLATVVQRLILCGSWLCAFPWRPAVGAGESRPPRRRRGLGCGGSVRDVRYLKNGAARAVRALRAAIAPAPAGRVVPLSAQMAGLRFTAAAEAAGIERRVTAHSGRVGSRRLGERAHQARRVNHRRDAGRQLENLEDGGTLLGRRYRGARCRGAVPVDFPKLRHVHPGGDQAGTGELLPTAPAVAANTEESRLMHTWWLALVLAVLGGGGVFYTLANSRVRTRARHAAHWWWQRRRTYGVGPIRAADRVRSGQ